MRLIKYLLIAMPFTTHCPLTNGQQTVITIDNTVREVSGTESCATNNWNNKEQDACNCCIGEQKNSTNADGQTIIEECKEQKYCTDALIDNLKKAKQVKTVTELVDKIYEEDVVIKLANYDITKLLTTQGKFTEASLKTFLTQAFQKNKLSGKDFSNPACLLVKDIASSGGGNTLQLFLVSSTCSGKKSFYIIKQMAKGIVETKNTEIIRNAPGMKELIAPNSLDGYPLLALPLFYLSYNHNGTENYLAIMPAASGVSFEKLLEQYNNDPSEENKMILEEAYESIGKQLALFYEKFMVPHAQGHLGLTVIHGDLRAANLFYDAQTKQAIFIDTETMAISIKKPRTMFVDFMRFVHFSIGRTAFTIGKMSNDKKNLFDLALKSFVRGYLSAYPQNLRQQIFYELDKIFNTTTPSILSQINKDIKSTTMINFNKNYVKPIFQELAKEFGYKWGR